MTVLAMWLAVLGVAVAFGVGLKVAALPLLPLLGDFGGLFLLAFTLAGVVAAWWFLCWLGFRLGIR